MTHSAWIGEREVVEVDYDTERLGFDVLLEKAIEFSCDQHVYETSDEQLKVARERLGERVSRLGEELRAGKASDQLYYLGRSHLRYVPLTPVQARRVNGALGAKGDPLHYLSTRQAALAGRIAAALAKQADALEELTRPARLAELDEYQAALTQRLELLGL